MKLIYLILGLLLIIILLGTIIINADKISTLSLLNNSIIEINTWILILSSSLMGGISTSLIFLYFLESIKVKSTKQARIAEKANIKAEESTDKVKALEAKIETLEQALKKALKDKK